MARVCCPRVLRPPPPARSPSCPSPRPWPASEEPPAKARAQSGPTVPQSGIHCAACLQPPMVRDRQSCATVASAMASAISSRRGAFFARAVPCSRGCARERGWPNVVAHRGCPVRAGVDALLLLTALIAALIVASCAPHGIESQTIAQLREHCRALGIRGFGQKNKAELVQLIRARAPAGGSMPAGACMSCLQMPPCLQVGLPIWSIQPTPCMCR